MSYRLVDCLLAGTPASKQSTNPYDIYLMLCVQSWAPDDGREDRPKHVEWYSINSKIVPLVDFTIQIYHDARSHERQKSVFLLSQNVKCFLISGVDDNKSISMTLKTCSLPTHVIWSRNERVSNFPGPQFQPFNAKFYSLITTIEILCQFVRFLIQKQMTPYRRSLF
jgi:hypothetical protein